MTTIQQLRAEMDQLMSFLQPWHNSLADPPTSQKRVLQTLLSIYSQTGYGQEHGAQGIRSIEDYRRAFPVATYADYQPMIRRVMEGETHLLLNEPPVGWAITHNATRGETGFFPLTPTDVSMRGSAERAIVNYVATTRRLELFAGVNLNIHLPSCVATVKVGDCEVDYGYSSGIYPRQVSSPTPIRSLPTQEEIDAIGGTKTQRDWERRFELAYECCKDQDVTMVSGAAPVALDFARYLHRKHGVYPRDIWKAQVMTLSSAPGINTRFGPALHAFYGPVAIREVYEATEGIFGQQKDDRRAWSPNYDLFFFEVATRRGIIGLHEMKPGEEGSLIVSTPIFPRYRIGDTILAVRPPYFRCIGRDDWWVPLRYIWDEVTSLNFGAL